MEPLAKPMGQRQADGSSQPITLADHTQHVRDEAARLLAARPFLARKYLARTGRDLNSLVDTAARWHDEGKLHHDWQQACQQDYQEYLRRGFTTGANLKQAGVRHEMESLVRLNLSTDKPLPLCGYTAIAAHHGKLGQKHESRWQKTPNYQALWKHFVGKGGEFTDPALRDAFDQAIARRYEYDGPRAILQLADHRASALEESQPVPDFRPFAYTFPHSEKRGVQQLVTQIWDEPFAILRAPTGAGKTDASLLWAQRQIDAGRADRLVIAMPTRFTANALSIAVTEALGSTGVYHSSAWFQAKAQPTAPGKAHWKKELAYARQLETPVTVTTIDHLCICLTGAREDHHGIFWALAHSCVVIDEADFYDDFTQRNMVVLLRALRLLDVPVLVMSATIPESARQLYAQAGQFTDTIQEDTSDSERTRCRLYQAGPCASPDDVAELLQRGINGTPLIIYANTVRRAQTYRRWFAERGFDDVVLYHSRFTEPDKATIEEQLKGMLGAEAWKADQQHGVAILTQIGELSVNVSANLMISDLCPIDRLTQRVGRLARFKDRGGNHVVGELYLVEPYQPDKEGTPHFYPAPYGHFRKGTGWEMTDILRKSQAWLQPGRYSAQRFVDLVNELYPELVPETAEVRTNRQLLEASVKTNWLILPFEEIAQEDDSTHVWKSRDIDVQKAVFANVTYSPFLEDDSDPSTFPNWFAFREWALLHSLTIPIYEYSRGIKLGMLAKHTIHIGGDIEEIFTVTPQHYSSQMGLMLYEQAQERNDDMDD
jgi:CRISPR-associated endonuclease/helicase Cas3